MWPSPVEYTGAVAGSMRNSKWMRNGKPRCRDKIDMDPQKVSFFGICLTNLSWNPNRPHPIHVHPYTLEKSRKLVQHHVIDTLWHVKLWVFFHAPKMGLHHFEDVSRAALLCLYNYIQLHTTTHNYRQWNAMTYNKINYIHLHTVTWNILQLNTITYNYLQ